MAPLSSKAPPRGPGARLVERFGLGAQAAVALNRILFQTTLDGPEELAQYIAERCGVPAAAALEASTELWHAQAEESWALPGAVEAVARLRRAGMPRAYISNIWSPFYQGFERLFPEEAQERANFLSFRMGLSKPDPAFYRAALEHLRVDPAEVVMIGDTYENDIAPVLELGMKAVWVLHRPHKEARDLVRVLNRTARAPDLTLGSIAELEPSVLERL